MLLDRINNQELTLQGKTIEEILDLLAEARRDQQVKEIEGRITKAREKYKIRGGMMLEEDRSSLSK